MILEIFNMYGMELVGLLLVILFGIFGMFARSAASKVLDTDTKVKLARLTVQFVEQVYRELHGPDKLNAALGCLSGLLAEKGLRATKQEMTVLLEAAVAEFNNAFHT